jgi:transposase-like protein
MYPIEQLCCQNPDCPAQGTRAKGNLVFRGWSGKGKRIRMVYCRSCKAHFSERKGTVLEQSRLPDEKVLDVLNHLREGCGTRGTGRMTGVDKNTVTRYVLLAGAHADKLHRELVALSPSDPRSPGR